MVKEKKEIILKKCLRVDYSSFIDVKDYCVLCYPLREV